jgi:hypothetical protein
MKERGRISIIKMADGTAGMHAIFEPGWTWEKDEKPLLGSPESCPMRHTGYCACSSDGRHGRGDADRHGRLLRDSPRS